MRLFIIIRGIGMDFRAWRRGERRVAPYGARGRIYEKKDSPSGSHQVEAKMSYKLLARVIRADGRPDEYFELSETNKLLTHEDYDNMREGKPDG